MLRPSKGFQKWPHRWICAGARPLELVQAGSSHVNWTQVWQEEWGGAALLKEAPCEQAQIRAWGSAFIPGQGVAEFGKAGKSFPTI